MGKEYDGTISNGGVAGDVEKKIKRRANWKGVGEFESKRCTEQST